MELLRPKADALKDRAVAMIDAVHFESTMPFATVQTRLNEFYRAYVHLAAWMAKMDDQRDIDLTAESLKKPLEQWISANMALTAQLWENLNERPEHKGTLRIDYKFQSKRAATLMRAKHIEELQRP